MKNPKKIIQHYLFKIILYLINILLNYDNNS